MQHRADGQQAHDEQQQQRNGRREGRNERARPTAFAENCPQKKNSPPPSEAQNALIRGHSVLKAVMASAGEAQLADVVLDERIKALADVCAHRARGSRSSRPSAAIPRITFTLTLFRSR